MAVWTWDPFAEIEALRREIDRAFDVAGVERGVSRFSPPAFLPGIASNAYPKVNVREDGSNYYVEALAPGLDPATVDVTVEQNRLRISGEKPAVEKTTKTDLVHRAERASGKFARSITMPADVNPAGVAADYRNGILRVTLPKAEAAKPKQIKVTVA